MHACIYIHTYIQKKLNVYYLTKLKICLLQCAFNAVQLCSLSGGIPLLSAALALALAVEVDEDTDATDEDD